MPDKVGRRCEFCGSTALVPYEQVKDAFRPESLLPLKIAEPQARDADSRLVRAAVARAERASRRRRSPTPSRASTCRTGRSTRRPTRTGRPNPATTTTCGRATSTCGRCAGRRPPASSRTSSTTSWCARRSAWTPRCCARVEPFPTDDARAVRPRLSGGLDGRALSDRSRRRGRSNRASRWTRSSGSCARAQVPGDTYRNLRVERRLLTTRRSSTSSRRCGC